MDGDVEEFKRSREIAVMHGRVASLATIGDIIPVYDRLPGAPPTLQALNFAGVVQFLFGG